MSNTKTEVTEKAKRDFADMEKILQPSPITVRERKTRNEVIDELVKESTGGKSRFSSDQLKFWGSTEKTLQEQIKKIVANNEKFQSVADFVDHAIEMQLIWWGENPSLLQERLSELIVTEPQKKYKEEYDKLLEQKMRERIQVGTPDESKKMEEYFIELKLNISKCFKGEFKFNKLNVEKNLMYDTYPILWKYYSRLLPIKATLHIINFIAQKNGKAYFETSDENIELAFKLLTQIGNILNKYDSGSQLQRNEKLSTGFPVSDEGEELAKIVTKIEAIKNRFKTHTVGKKSTKKIFESIKENIGKEQPITDEKKYENFTDVRLESLITVCNNLKEYDWEIIPKGRNWDEMKLVFENSVIISKDKIEKYEGAFQGALNALDLVIPFYDKKEDKTRIYISQKGYEFLKLKNPILEKLDVITDITKKMKDGKEYNKILHGTKFSREEIHFIIGKLIPTKLSLEYKIILRIISALSNKPKLDPEYVERLIVESCIDWAYEYPEVFLSQEIDAAVAQYYNVFWEGDTHGGIKHEWQKLEDVKIHNKEIIAWRMATMGRLGEMGIINWQMGDDHGKAEYSKGENFDTVEKLPELTRQEIIASRKDYEEILYRKKNPIVDPGFGITSNQSNDDSTELYDDEPDGYTEWARKKNDL